MSVPFWNPGKEYESVAEDITRIEDEVRRRGALILKEDVEKFEKELAQYVGTKYAVAVHSGCDAITLSLVALGIERGDKVLTAAYTFRGTLEAIHHAGGIPVQYDMDGTVEFTDVKFFVPVYLSGEIPPYAADCIRAARHAGVKVVEDACQAIGAAPVMGNAAVYSFYPAKLLGCYGDGGAVATDDKELYEKLLRLRNHDKPHWNEIGYNSRLDNVKAAVLSYKLKRLPEEIRRRQHIAQQYDRAFHTISEITPQPARAIYQDYIIETLFADAIHDFLNQRGIQTMKNEYPFPVLYPKLPKAAAYEKNTLRLPCNGTLSDDEVQEVITAIQDFFQNVNTEV